MASTAIAKMRAKGVTTVAMFADPFTAIAVINAASEQSYFPEWLVPGVGSMDRAYLAQYYDPSQWRHAFGISAVEIPRPQTQQDYYKAYKEVDPGGTPQQGYLGIGRTLFLRLLQVANGIQLAGPHLTPQSVLAGIMKMPRRAPDPPWSVGGYYAPGHWAFSDYVSLMWWDTTATDPETGNAGAYRFLLDGKRLRPGEIPTAPLPWFRTGITQAPGS